jgi:hypothetical protein
VLALLSSPALRAEGGEKKIALAMLVQRTTAVAR